MCKSGAAVRVSSTSAAQSAAAWSALQSSRLVSGAVKLGMVGFVLSGWSRHFPRMHRIRKTTCGLYRAARPTACGLSCARHPCILMGRSAAAITNPQSAGWCNARYPCSVVALNISQCCVGATCDVYMFLCHIAKYLVNVRSPAYTPRAVFFERRAQPGGGRSPDPHCQRCGQDGKHWHASRVPPVWVAATLPSSSSDEVNRMIGAVSLQSRQWLQAGGFPPAPPKFSKVGEPWSSHAISTEPGRHAPGR